ncbi:MAG: GTP-binding protein, partial [Chloroflexi bacterium]|nr:GTP-binding protein [Chloroflexota bacterium]
MKEYATEFIRNIALVSHGGGGKTILGEAMLFCTGAITRMGRVEDGNTVSDFEDEEIRRTLSLSTTLLPVEFKEHKLNILDTPGYTDFVGEVISTISVADAAVVLVDSVAGVEVGTEIVWEYCETFKLPRFVVISKMDRDNANFKTALSAASELSPDATFIPVQLPWGEKSEFKGVIDLFNMKARPAEGEVLEDIPAEYKEQAEEARIALVEAAAEGDDALLEKYLEGEELTAAEITKGFKSVVRAGRFIPVFVSAAGKTTGVVPLMEAMIEIFPSPADAEPVKAQGASGEEVLEASDSGPLAVRVWKTTADPFV